MFHTQRLCSVFGNRQQTVNIGVLTRVATGIYRMLGKHLQTLLGGIDIDRAPDLCQMVINRQRALATGLVFDGGNQIAQLCYPHLSSAVIFDKVEEMYRRFYFRPRKIGAIMGEMLRDWDVMKRRLREGVEFFDFLRRRKEAA